MLLVFLALWLSTCVDETGKDTLGCTGHTACRMMEGVHNPDWLFYY